MSVNAGCEFVDISAHQHLRNVIILFGIMLNANGFSNIQDRSGSNTPFYHFSLEPDAVFS